jgi:pyrroloquinoline quinone biosynthesis protein D
MSAELARDRPIAIARGFRLQWEDAQNAHVLLYPEGMVRLSESAGAILSRCDGERTLDGVLDSLREAFPGADLDADVVEFLTIALEKGWIEYGRH